MPITPRIMQMLTKNGFVSLFWSDLKTQRKQNQAITHQQVYDKMEQEYKQATGQRRYTTFDSFRKVRDRCVKHRKSDV